jgi:hypothetical protein
MTIRLHRRVLGAIALIALVATAEGAAAFAATPIKGATYEGKIAHTSNVAYSISFKVSANGKRVSNFTLTNGYPVYCQGGGFGTVQKASGTVAKNGTFDVKLPIYFSPSQHQGFVIINGRFAKHDKESGKVMTDFTHGTTCNGTSRYATKG